MTAANGQCSAKQEHKSVTETQHDLQSEEKTTGQKPWLWQRNPLCPAKQPGRETSRDINSLLFSSGHPASSQGLPVGSQWPGCPDTAIYKSAHRTHRMVQKVCKWAQKAMQEALSANRRNGCLSCFGSIGGLSCRTRRKKLGASSILHR